jgi:hypothetical protein
MKRWIVASLLTLVFASGSGHAAEKSGDKPSKPVSRDFTVGKPATVRDATVEDIKAFFERENRKVLTFVGYSGAGYEHEASMLKQAERVLREFDPTRTIVNGGATSEGIGAVYKLVKRKGFLTTGIVSTQAKQYNAELSPYVDQVFYVGDATWGGFIEGSERLSPTSKAMVENSDIIVGIGGGEVARDEMIAARRSGKEVRFIPADMNHQKAQEKARKKGLPVPTDFSGAAAEVF